MKITLSSDLEKALLRSVAEGVSPPSVVDPKELSKKGQAIHGALVYLLKKKAVPPIKPASILLTAASLYGFPKAAAEAYLQSFRDLQTGPEIVTILKAARDKAALVSVINAAGEQLASGSLDSEKLASILDDGHSQVAAFESVAGRIGEKFGKPVAGVPLASLPELSKAANGFAGIWVIGGEPGLGKSTLALQISLDYAQHHPVAYYDIDGTGEAYFMDRLRVIFDSNMRKFKAATNGFYLRDNIDDLEADIKRHELKPPSLIVVDSIQTLPTTKWAKDSTGEWLEKFKRLVQRGYALLLISEKPRSQYGQAEIGGFKNSGAIEYSGTICAHILEDDDDSDLLKVIFVKNRHGPRKGHIVNLIRDEDKVFVFKEERAATYVKRHSGKRDS